MKIYHDSNDISETCTVTELITRSIVLGPAIRSPMFLSTSDSTDDVCHLTRVIADVVLERFL